MRLVACRSISILPVVSTESRARSPDKEPQRSLGGGSDQGRRVRSRKEKIGGRADCVLDNRIHFDQVFVTSEHQGLFTVPRVASAAVLQIPLVCGWFSTACDGRCHGAKADLRELHLLRLDPRYLVDWPRQLVMQARPEAGTMSKTKRRPKRRTTAPSSGCTTTIPETR